MDLDHGAHQAVWDLQTFQDVEDVHLLVHRLRVADVSHVHYEVLEHARKHEGTMVTHRPLLINEPPRYGRNLCLLPTIGQDLECVVPFKQKICTAKPEFAKQGMIMGLLCLFGDESEERDRE